MDKKKTIYCGPPLMEVVRKMKEGQGISSRLNQVAERYLAILREHGVDLTDEEATILGNCLSGTFVDPLLIRHLADEVEDSDFADEEAAKSLIRKLRSASYADLVATVERLGF